MLTTRTTILPIQNISLCILEFLIDGNIEVYKHQKGYLNKQFFYSLLEEKLKRNEIF